MQIKIKFFKRTSPISYVNTHTPPVISIHGDKDVNVPFEHSAMLHTLLTKHGVTNQLINIAGKKHGNFSQEEMTMAFATIWKFLEAIK